MSRENLISNAEIQQWLDKREREKQSLLQAEEAGTETTSVPPEETGSPTIVFEYTNRASWSPTRGRWIKHP